MMSFSVCFLALLLLFVLFFFFFFNDTATTEIYTLSLHDALPICGRPRADRPVHDAARRIDRPASARSEEHTSELQSHHDLVCRLLLEKKKNEHRLRHSRKIQVEEVPEVRFDEVRMVQIVVYDGGLAAAACEQCEDRLFFFNDTPTTEIYTLSLHDALPISHDHALDLLRLDRAIHCADDRLERALR